MASGPAAAASTGEKYPILLQRDAEPGKPVRLRLKEESVEHTVMRAQGKVLSDERKTTTQSFVGTSTALAAGRHQPVEYVVEELTRTKQGQSAALLPPGAKISAKVVDKAWHYEIDGQQAPEELEQALQSLLGASADDTSDDDIFGSKVPRAIGETWNADVNRLPPDPNVALDPRGASGSTRLVARRTINGVDCLEIQADLTVPNVILKAAPPGAEVLAASITGKFAGMFPTDLKRPVLSQGTTTDLHLEMRVQSPDGPVDLAMEVHHELTGSHD